nr:glutamate receptor 2.8-like [Ziziphus jujuba var. spinosa]
MVFCVNAVENGSIDPKLQRVEFGVVLDLASSVGKMANGYISMALSDFYIRNASYRTKLVPLVKDSGKDVVEAASAATSPSLSPIQNPFFIRTAQDDSSQVKALTSIVEAYGWKEINMIMTRETRILSVHMSFSLGLKLFPLAKEVGMMSEGYAWIITDGLSPLLDPLGAKVIDSMHGVVGVRPCLPESKRLRDFKTKRNKTSGDVNLFGLGAYDTVWALAMVAELAGQLNPNAFRNNFGMINSSQPFGLKVSKSGPELFQMLQNTKFEGVYGKFNLTGGQLQATDFEIINVRSTKQSNGTYDVLLTQIKLKKFDAVVGDTTINANRSTYIDFTLPYSESGVSMIVKVKDDETKNIWIFLKPLRWDLWLTILSAFIFTGIVSYTASLASMLMVQRMRPAFIDVNENSFVGYQNNSYVEELLTQQLNFSKSRLRPYTSPKDYHVAMSKGSKYGGIDAIFDEVPYVKLLLAKYCSNYIVVGPTFKSGGFGFAFPKGSPLVPYFSRAILNITQDPNKMQELERKYFEDETKCEDPGSTLSTDNPSLSVQSERALWFRVTRMDVPLHDDRGGEVSLSSNGNHLHSPSTALITIQHAVNQTTAVDDEVEQFHRIHSGHYTYGCA